MVNNCRATKKKLTISIGLALALGPVYADFGPSFDLSDLNGTNGFTVNGANAGDESGASASFAGDVNGDGLDDLIVGAPYATTTASNAGKSYLIFGSTSISNPLNLSEIDGTNGILINGESVFDFSGSSVGAAGDINGDGIDDVIIGAPSASPGAGYSGATYVVFGDGEGLASPIDLSSIDGTNGIVFNGVNAYDESGTAVSAAGDINGDGTDDLIIGAPFASGGDGAGYVVFGSDQAWVSPIDLSGLNGTNGFAITAAGEGDSLGISVSAAGDINGDTIDDLIIGAVLAGSVGAYSGASYVVFGSDEPWSSAIDLSLLDGSNGFAINGVNANDEAGASVSAAGDLNADGIGDLIIGAPKADPNGGASGASYLVFGSNQAWTSPLNLSSLNGTNGVVLNGVSAGHESGTSVSAAGDINADGFDDVIIGAPAAGPDDDGSGASYVVYGHDQAWTATIDLSDLDGTNGFVIWGVNAGDNSGKSVSAAGDLNMDGFTDLVIGARLADPNGDKSGTSYVLYGGDVGDDDLIFADSFE